VRKRAVAVAGALAFFAGSGAALAATPEISSNWSGYVATAPAGAPATFSDVTATWIQPKPTCSVGRQDSAAFWVGLGGNDATSPALEQLGTGLDCDGTSTAPVSSAWWEIVPAAAVPIKLIVRPGDRVNAAVLVNGQTVTMSLKNLTRHTRFSKVLTLTQPLDVSSAEWIAEAPSTCTDNGRCTPVPLTRFGQITFSNAATIGNAHPGTISDPASSATPVWLPTAVELISDGSTGRFLGSADPLGPGVGAMPTDLSVDGRSFSVSWHSSLAP
jgi:hypothetical protein